RPDAGGEPVRPPFRAAGRARRPRPRRRRADRPCLRAPRGAAALPLPAAAGDPRRAERGPPARPARGPGPLHRRPRGGDPARAPPVVLLPAALASRTVLNYFIHSIFCNRRVGPAQRRPIRRTLFGNSSGKEPIMIS